MVKDSMATGVAVRYAECVESQSYRDKQRQEALKCPAAGGQMRCQVHRKYLNVSSGLSVTPQFVEIWSDEVSVLVVVELDSFRSLDSKMSASAEKTV